MHLTLGAALQESFVSTHIFLIPCFSFMILINKFFLLLYRYWTDRLEELDIKFPAPMGLKPRISKEKRLARRDAEKGSPSNLRVVLIPPLTQLYEILNLFQIIQFQ